MKKIYGLLLSVALVWGEHELAGKHHHASFHQCDHERINHIEELRQAFIEAANEAGISPVNTMEEIFEGERYSLIIISKEGHLTMHTFPDYHTAFFDFLSLGSMGIYAIFEEIMEDFLGPERIETETIRRH